MLCGGYGADRQALTLAAGARVETAELTRHDDDPPSALVEVPLGCSVVVCAATETTVRLARLT